MNEDKIIQIIPAPANMLYAFEDGKTGHTLSPASRSSS